MHEVNTKVEEVPLEGSRRNFFKTFFRGGAILPVGVAGAGIFTSCVTQAGSRHSPISWVHGNSATIVGENELEIDIVQGNARIVRGRSWSTVPLHFSIPSPGLETGVPMCVSAIWVRLQSSSGAKIAAMALHDCETTLSRIEGMELRQQEWGDVRIALQPSRRAMRSIGLTLDCEFADLDRQIGISAVGCEFLQLG